MESCSSCCSQCSTQLIPTPPGNAADPYALYKLIKAGTIVVQFNGDNTEALCDHAHAEDGWHVLSGHAFLSQLPTHEPIYDAFHFLTFEHFITATYRFEENTKQVFIRVYMIPYDLSGVQGSLRVRKDKILVPARKSLRQLLPLISKDPNLWQGRASPLATPDLLPGDKDRRTLSEIYGDIKSPSPSAYTHYELSPVSQRLLDPSDNLIGFGLRSRLYGYQRRTVAAMIEKEMDDRDIPDPLFITLRSIDDEPYYFQPGTMEVLREQPTTAPGRSGILCEELGTGKTVMTLALILSTLNQISAPEESIIDERPVMTPLSFRHFPSAVARMARKRFFRKKKDKFSNQQNEIPSLMELLIHLSRIRPNTQISSVEDPEYTFLDHIENIRAGDPWRHNVPFYHHYPEEPLHTGTSKRGVSATGPKVMYLTSATLVVVPANLLSQWDREIQKHCSYPLRVLVLRPDTKMPHATSLASDYDIILMTHKRYTMESTRDDTESLHTWDACPCPPLYGSRVPECKCTFPKASPLLQIRWKRLVIDEGHVSASLQSILTPFTKMLSVERRWIVTGTPTTNLLGLSLGTKTAEDVDSEDLGEYEPEPESAIPSTRSPSPTPETSEVGGGGARIWNKIDRLDLGKLGKMITHFVAVPQFSASGKLMNTHVVEPLLDPQGTRGGATEVLTQVMESTMLRHRIEDVEGEVLLPPLRHENVLLDMDMFAVKSYNALQATIAVNAVDSERTDQDYIFHMRNAESLQLVVKNMSQLMFWRTDDDLYNVDELHRTANEHIQRALDRNAPEADIKLLKEAFEHIRIAAEDPLWRAMQGHEDVPYRVSGLDQAIFDSWTRTPQRENSYNTTQIGFLHADRLLKMLDIVTARPLVPPQAMIEMGAVTAAEDKRHRELYIQSQKNKDRRSSGASSKHEEINASMKSDESVKKANSTSTLKELQKDFDEAISALNEDGEKSVPAVPEAPAWGQSLLSTSLLNRVRLGSTASSKLNFIMNEVLTYSKDEKFLIFSDSPLTLAHVSEALELMHVKFLRFTTTTPPRVREQIVLTFETSDKYRVFLMELKHGARGLNLISASRMIFCEPVWQADVESQAIKRVHRIGQTRDITVKTLAIRGTAEQNMMERRDRLKAEGSHQKLPKMTEETGMRHYIANPKFITYEPERYSTVDLPLLTVAPQSPGNAEDTMGWVTTVESPPLKRPRVTVSDELVIRQYKPPQGDGSPSPSKKTRLVRFD